jgi:small subunit ribosomal protein S6
MIYELGYVLRTDCAEEGQVKITSMIADVVKEFAGEVLIKDNWGVKSFAQSMANGTRRGNYFYVLYKANTSCNAEIERRFRISEDILKYLFVKLGEDKDQAKIVKGYANPNNAIQDPDATFDADKERKMFQKRKSCYFSAKKISPDWKDVTTYGWLVNEFGKISPARVTGLRPKFQRQATTAIKRARCMGLISYMSSQTARS